MAETIWSLVPPIITIALSQIMKLQIFICNPGE